MSVTEAILGGLVALLTVLQLLERRAWEAERSGLLDRLLAATGHPVLHEPDGGDVAAEATVMTDERMWLEEQLAKRETDDAIHRHGL